MKYSLWLSTLLALSAAALAAEPPKQEGSGCIPHMVAADGRLRLDFTPERVILPRGLQPSMVCAQDGTLIVQAQIPEKPAPSKRMTYFSAMETRVSRDGGATWSVIPLRPGDNGLNLEGGGVALRDGTIVALDTYIMPGEKDGTGIGQLYLSKDHWKSLEGPIDVPFDLPGIDFTTSTDDGGRPHAAQRLHRRILKLPNGDLLTCFYGWMKGDTIPCEYIASMKRTRLLFARSADRGRSWRLASHISAGMEVGSEGLGEPTIVQLKHGPHRGRVICLARTGRNLLEYLSDDEARTWTAPKERIFAGLDINRTELWVDFFRNHKDFTGRPLDESNPDQLRGAVVDPDLIELRSGVLVAAFGVRVPMRLCWRHPEHPWNGNYLAFSMDHGATWPNVVRITSGVLTTHYMALEETPEDNKLYLAYDLGGWSKGMRRDVIGRHLTVTSKIGK